MSKFAKPGELNEQREMFCLEYIKDLNGTRAAQRAGYGQNYETSAVQATRLLKNAKVQERISTLAAERAGRIGVDADTVLKELLRLATVDISEAYDGLGQLKPIKEMSEDVRRAISSVEAFEEFRGDGEERALIGFTKKLKFWDKPKALELLGKHLKLFTEQVEHKITLADSLKKARERAGKS